MNPACAVASNVVGTFNVFEAAIRNGVRRAVFASSNAAYGERHDLMREDDPKPVNPSFYGETSTWRERSPPSSALLRARCAEGSPSRQTLHLAGTPSGAASLPGPG